MTQPIQEPLKECSSCKELKPHGEFYKHNQTKDGLRSWCIPCYKQKTFVYEQRSERRKAYLKTRNRQTNPWRDQHPEETRAQAAVQRAVREGLLHRPHICEQCGTSERRIEAHHDDYSNRLDVRWLCIRCHRLHHTAMAKA